MSSPNHTKRILILGGTSEAAQLATRLGGRPGVTIISSLAGRVSQPNMPQGIVRIGGFGGVDGLTSYLAQESIDVVIDATHSFASRISANAELSCDAAKVPLIVFERPPWQSQEGDSWLSVPDLQSAASLANDPHNRVFLSIGRQELGAFSECEKAWFLVRTIDEPHEKLPKHSKLILQRGPFDLDEERQLLRNESINLIVSKNSGGRATCSKIEVAREISIPVVMIDRPLKRKTPAVVATLDDVLIRLAEFI
jgi:precorrin-6A/cobalt-precorrin-6A reductase